MLINSKEASACKKFETAKLKCETENLSVQAPARQCLIADQLHEHAAEPPQTSSQEQNQSTILLKNQLCLRWSSMENECELTLLSPNIVLPGFN